MRLLPTSRFQMRRYDFGAAECCAWHVTQPSSEHLAPFFITRGAQPAHDVVRAPVGRSGLRVQFAVKDLGEELDEACLTSAGWAVQDHMAADEADDRLLNESLGVRKDQVLRFDPRQRGG